MSKFAIRLLTLAITASVTVAPAMAETAKKHHRHFHRAIVVSDPGPVWLAPGPSADCPSLAQPIECDPYGEYVDHKKLNGE
jgi:hypothetical protein